MPASIDGPAAAWISISRQGGLRRGRLPPCSTTSSPRWARSAAAARAAASASRSTPTSRRSLPLTPLQRGILLHSLREPETYFDQLHLSLTARSTPLLCARPGARVVRAPPGAARRLPLRRDGASGPAHPRDAPIRAGARSDWRDLDESERKTGAWRPCWRPTAPPASTSRARPCCACTWCVRGEERHELVWSGHHLLLDGWSVSQVMIEVAALYREAHRRRTGEPAAAHRTSARYLGWLDTVDDGCGPRPGGRTNSPASRTDPARRAGPGAGRGRARRRSGAVSQALDAG